MDDHNSDRRLSPLSPDVLDADQLGLYRLITEGPRARDGRAALVDPEGRLRGPFDAMLRSPVVGEAFQNLGATLRYRTSVSARVREIVILAVAHAEDSAFERSSHEILGRAVGLSDHELIAIRHGQELPGEDQLEHAALTIARALLERGDLDDGVYASAVAAVGERALFEILTLVGYYRTIALQLRVFRIGAPDRA